MLGRDVLISWVRNIPWSSQKTKDFRREIIWDFFAIFFQVSRYRARFQASSGHSDSANRPGYEADQHHHHHNRRRHHHSMSRRFFSNTLTMDMLWLNYILSLNFTCLCFKDIIIHFHSQKQRQINRTTTKPQQIHTIRLYLGRGYFKSV